MGPHQSKINTAYLQFTDGKWVLRDVNGLIQGLEEAGARARAAVQVFWLLGSFHKMLRCLLPHPASQRAGGPGWADLLEGHF